eukprot:1415257-Prymnesium_polylepis.1
MWHWALPAWRHKGLGRRPDHEERTGRHRPHGAAQNAVGTRPSTRRCPQWSSHRSTASMNAEPKIRTCKLRHVDLSDA